MDTRPDTVHWRRVNHHCPLWHVHHRSETFDRAGSGLGQAIAVALHTACVTVVAVDGSEAGLKELPDGSTAKWPTRPTPTRAPPYG
jgi:hypothetical protein